MNYGRYKIVKKLGKGSMGEVFQAHDLQIDRMVALKVLRKERVIGGDFSSRFLKEAKAIGRLSHPNIVTVYDVGRDHGTVYIAMEFLEGKPFDEIMRHGQMDFEQIVDIGMQVAMALNYAHEKGIVHRDIKPSNIILLPDGQVKLTDFGIARIEDSNATQQTQIGDILGTPAHMSPEQVLGVRVDGRSDLYSLGIFLYELTTGRKPFLGDNIAAIFNSITRSKPIAPSKINPSIPKEFCELIEKALSKNPDERFQNGAAMTDALKICLETKVLTALPKDKMRETKISGVFFLIISIMVIAILGGISYFIGSWFNQSESISEPNKVNIQAKYSVLNLTSLPTGAQVYLDDSFNGKTPLNLKVPLGKYKVRLSLPDYYEWEAQLDLNEQGEIPLFVRLMPMQ